MTESTALTKKAQASSPPPSFSLLPAVHTIIDEASPELLREAMKLMTKNSVEDARTVTLMLDQAQYNVGDLDDSDDESSSLSIEYEGYIDSDPITDTLFQALLSRQAELQARNEREREERQAAMAKRRQKRRDQQRTMDKVIELDHERKEILDQASELKRDIHLLHERKAPKAAITELTRHYRIKDHAVDMYKQQILALSDIPVRHVHCEFCGEGFDANRNELGDCRRHTGKRYVPWNSFFRTKDIKASGRLAHLLESIDKDVAAKELPLKNSLRSTNWSCCRELGDHPGCNIGKHKEKRG